MHRNVFQCKNLFKGCPRISGSIKSQPLVVGPAEAPTSQSFLQLFSAKLFEGGDKLKLQNQSSTILFFHRKNLPEQGYLGKCFLRGI